MWPNGDLYFDEEEEFKKAISGGREYRALDLFRPATLWKLASNVRKSGAASNDISDKKTKLMGGTFVVLKNEVVYVHRENSNFDNGDARELLAAVLQKDLADVPQLGSPTLNGTPKQEEVCTRQ